MPKDMDILSSDAYTRVREETKRKGGSATSAGEQRHREGKGLHPTVDPKSYGVIRRSLNRFDETGKHPVLTMGVAMLVETRFDTTSSMGDSLDQAFESLLHFYDLLKTGKNPVLKRYDAQLITSMFNDVGDDYVLIRSMAEMGAKIAEQMTLMVPQRAGGDEPEDPQYGIFGGAYLTAADINRYGLKSYDFTVSDAPARDEIDPDVLVKVFGKEVFEKVEENGFKGITKDKVPSTKETVKALLQRAHGFFLQVRGRESVSHFWTSLYGRERVVKLPSAEVLPQVQASIIGLTEGVLDLQTLEGYLVKEGGLEKDMAQQIKKAVANIPIGVQSMLPNFTKLPEAGSLFANKRDLWPATEASLHEGKDESKKETKIWKRKKG